MRSLLSLLSIMLVMTGCAQQAVPKPMVQSTQSDKLSVADFKALWQATNTENNTAFQISRLPQSFSDSLHLEAAIGLDQKIERLSIIGTPQSKKDRFMMISCWAQLIMTMTRSAESTPVTSIFRAMGIDPNADVTALTGATVILNGDTYRSWHENGTYTFQFEEDGA